MIYYITKYALTSGIIEKEGEVVIGLSGKDMLVCRMNGVGWSPSEYYHGNDFHKTKEDAIIDANHRLSRKITTLKKTD
jgi:hypothetical protein